MPFILIDFKNVVIEIKLKYKTNSIPSKKTKKHGNKKIQVCHNIL